MTWVEQIGDSAASEKSSLDLRLIQRELIHQFQFPAKILWVRVNVLLILPWTATSTRFVGFHAGPAYLPQRVPGTHYSWVGLSNVTQVPCSKNTATRVALHSPVRTAGSTGARQVKFLAQGNNNRRVCQGIEPGVLHY